ncbi:MAG: alpha/beta fold hydrolase [Pseudodesulfovibrio sp.]|nr:alpha/beta fold hydrolase [Pseudodesulfovibrio sp.]
MNNACLIWCHGSQSQPWGNKSKSLADTASAAGLSMDALDFQDMPNADDRVTLLVDKVKSIGRPAILAGSSMGGYVACAASKDANILGLFLLAPAFYLPNYDRHVFSGLPKNISMVHGWNDNVIPVENSIRFSKLHKANLHILNDDHRLENSTGIINHLFVHFLKSIASRETKQDS